jgi:hypothetical protein
MRRPKAPPSLVSSATGVVAQGSVVFGRKGNTDGGFMLDPHCKRANHFPRALSARKAPLGGLFAGLTLVDLG